MPTRKLIKTAVHSFLRSLVIFIPPRKILCLSCELYALMCKLHLYDIRGLIQLKNRILFKTHLEIFSFLLYNNTVCLVKGNKRYAKNQCYANA